MKNKKRIIFILVIFVFFISGCNSKKESKTENESEIFEKTLKDYTKCIREEENGNSEIDFLYQDSSKVYRKRYIYFLKENMNDEDLKMVKESGENLSKGKNTEYEFKENKDNYLMILNFSFNSRTSTTFEIKRNLERDNYKCTDYD